MSEKIFVELGIWCGYTYNNGGFMPVNKKGDTKKVRNDHEKNSAVAGLIRELEIAHKRTFNLKPKPTPSEGK